MSAPFTRNRAIASYGPWSRPGCRNGSLRPSFGIEPAAQPGRLRHEAIVPANRTFVQTGNSMRRRFSFLAAAAGFAAALAAFAAPAYAEKRVALVIGNNDYKNVPKLQKAVNDAR